MTANLESVEQVLKDILKGTNRLKVVSVTKPLAAAAAYDAGDVLCENATTGTCWVFSFGGTGYLTKAIVVSETTALTPPLIAYLYKDIPTGELRDHAANTNPLKADTDIFIGSIEFPAMKSLGTGMSQAEVNAGDATGKLPKLFDTPKIYVILASPDAFTQGAGKNMTLSLAADIVGG